jgi:hypothetical protein
MKFIILGSSIILGGIIAYALGTIGTGLLPIELRHNGQIITNIGIVIACIGFIPDIVNFFKKHKK